MEQEETLVSSEVLGWLTSPDVACPGDGCPLRRDCRRYAGRQDGRKRVSWLAVAPWHSDGSCELFEPVDSLGTECLPPQRQ